MAKTHFAHRSSGQPSRVALILTLVICLSVLGAAVWLLLIPHKSAAVDGVIETSASVPNAFVAVLEGETTQLDSDLIWTSSDTAIATVDESGTVTGISQGSCTISAGETCYQVAVRKLENKTGCTYVDGILVVNKSYSLPETYDPGLQPIAKAAFSNLCTDAAAEGLDIYDGSDYRSYDYQVKIYNNYVNLYGWEKADTFSARPGYSEHQSGLTIDCNTIDDAFGETEEAAWLAEHCAAYGFILRFPEGKEDITGYKYEPWHIRYVGVEVATEMTKWNLTLEEYLGITSVYGSDWE